MGGLLKIDFYRNYIIEIEGKKFSDKIFSDTVFQLNSKQKKTKTILLITHHFLSIFQSASNKKTIVKKFRFDTIIKLQYLEQSAVMLCISFKEKGDLLIETYQRFDLVK